MNYKQMKIDKLDIKGDLKKENSTIKDALK